MANETFNLMIRPDQMSIEHFTLEDNRNINRSVWGFRDTIAVVATFATKEKIEVWIMKEYGVEDSWNILCSIPVGSNKGLFDVVGIYNEERIFLCGNNEKQLISYGIDDDDDDEVIEHDVQSKLPCIKYGNIGLFNYVESFARLQL
uniref:F-box associated domain-containing protein n=1 Tax=Chenopodium quinoa TaxID=63459 RepID=A0A803L7J7_CHEQI